MFLRNRFVAVLLENRLEKRRLILERLEDRLVLAQILWDGGGGDRLWSNPLNWSSNQLPSADDDAHSSQHNGRPSLPEQKSRC